MKEIKYKDYYFKKCFKPLPRSSKIFIMPIKEPPVKVSKLRSTTFSGQKWKYPFQRERESDKQLQANASELKRVVGGVFKTYQTSVMKLFGKIVNGYQLLTIFAKSSMRNVS